MDDGEISRLLDEHRNGSPDALQRLMPLLYDELRRLAAFYMRGEREGHTLQPTALVNEAYLKLVGREQIRWDSRAHLFALAAQVMRHVLVDHARGKRRGKRGGGQQTVVLDEALGLSDARDLDVEALDDALKALEKLDPRQSRVVELRYFGGLSVEETSEVLGVATSTVNRDWATAKLWLRREILRGGTTGPDAG